MEQNIGEAETHVNLLYTKFKNNSESYQDISTKGKRVEGYGDVLYGLRIRLQDENRIKCIENILLDSGYKPTNMIKSVSYKLDYIEVSIEFDDILEIIEK